MKTFRLFVLSHISPENEKHIGEYLNSKFSEHDKSGIFVSENDLGNPVVLTTLDNNRLSDLFFYMSSIGVAVEDYDATPQLLEGKFDENIQSVLKDSERNYQMITEIVQNSLTVDDVLDKINICGIDSLIPYELKVLRDFK